MVDGKTSTESDRRKNDCIRSVASELRKNFMSHWVLSGLYHEFVVENVNTWDPHPVSIVHQEVVTKNYTTLAEGERGPQIAEHRNSILTQFPIKGKHKETVALLTNFITKSLQRVSTNGRIGEHLLPSLTEIKFKK